MDYQTAKSDGDHNAAYEIAHRLVVDGDVASGREVLEWLSGEGDDRATHQLGLLLTESGEIDEAISLLERAVVSGLSGARLSLANVLSDIAGHEAKAEEEYRRAIEEGSPDARFNLALLLLDGGRVTEGQSLLRDLIGEDDPDALVTLIESLIESGSTSEAYDLLDIHETTVDVDALREAGVSLWSKGHNEAAEHLLLKALNLGDKSAANYLGKLYSEIGRPSDALDLYRSELDRGNMEVRLNLADELSSDPSREAEVRRLFLDAIEVGELEAYNNYGLYLRQRGDKAEAMEMYRFGVEGGDSYAMRNLALLLREVGDSEQAIAMMRNSVDAGLAKGLLELGSWASEDGDPDSARDFLQQAIDAGVSGAANAMALQRWNDSPVLEVEALLREGAEEGDHWAAFNLGIFLGEHGRDEESAEAYQWAIDLGSVDALVNLASLYLAGGQEDLARDFLVRAKSLGDDLAPGLLAELSEEG